MRLSKVSISRRLRANAYPDNMLVYYLFETLTLLMSFCFETFTHFVAAMTFLWFAHSTVDFPYVFKITLLFHMVL